MSKMGPMFNPEDHARHFGPGLSLSPRLDPLRPVERAFAKACHRRGLMFAFDISADEPPYFSTMNYTSYAGLFIMHPLQTELSLRQMFDALRDSSKTTRDFTGFLRERLSQGAANKYIAERKETARFREALVVLPGTNRLKTHICINKLKWIYDKHGDDVVFKPHPITDRDILTELRTVTGIPASAFADPSEDLYPMLYCSDTVYTTHVSESAAYAALISKAISPIDAVQSRARGSFTHINYFFFTEPDPDSWVNTMFSSPKSGIIHPDVDEDWEAKIDSYLDYIIDLRERFKDAYIHNGSKK